MKFSLSTHLFVYDKLTEEHLQMVAASGVSSIELWCMKPHFRFHDWNTVKMLRNWLEKLHLDISSIHAPFYRNFEELYAGKTLHLTDKDPDGRTVAINEILTSLKTAADIGAPIAVVHAGTKGDPADENHRSLLLTGVEKLLTKAEDLKISIALENIRSDLSHFKMLASIISHFNSSSLGVCVDVGHSNISDDPMEAVKYLKKNLINTHIHDNNGEKDDHLWPFEGTINWKKLSKALRDAGYNGYWTLEPRKYETSYEDHFAAMKRAIKQLEALNDG